MQIDVIFSIARAYNVKRVDVLKGQSFAVVTDAPAGARWFADNDPTISLQVTGPKGLVTANETGVSEIQFQDAGGTILDRLLINVVETLEQAETLVTTGETEPK